MTATKYVTLDGLTYFKGKLDNLFRTEAQVETQITNRLSTYSTNLVVVRSAVPSVQDAEEGKIYLVPDGNALTGELQYIAYTKEEIDDGQGGTAYQIVTIGHSRVTVPAADATPTQNSDNPVQSGGVYTALQTKVDKTDDVTSSVSNGETKVVTSGGVYTALQGYIPNTNIASSVSSGDTTNVVTGDAVATYVSGELQNYVETANVATSVTSGDSKVVTGDAVYDFVTSQMGDIQSVTNPEIDVMFMAADEIWIDSTGWATMKAKFDASGAFETLTKNSSGYYVIKPSAVTGTVNTLVLATADDSISTGALTDVTSASDLAGLAGKIVSAADEATALTILA